MNYGLSNIWLTEKLLVKEQRNKRKTLKYEQREENASMRVWSIVSNARTRSWKRRSETSELLRVRGRNRSQLGDGVGGLLRNGTRENVPWVRHNCSPSWGKI